MIDLLQGWKCEMRHEERMCPNVFAKRSYGRPYEYKGAVCLSGNEAYYFWGKIKYVAFHLDRREGALIYDPRPTATSSLVTDDIVH